MRLKRYIIFILISFVFIACQNNKREEELGRRERNLKEREQQFSLKEADYHSLLHMRDSLLAGKDTAVVQSWPKAISGQWKSTVICKESNCSNYVIGDQRTETWKFQSDSTGLFTQVLNDQKLIRVYIGHFMQNQINLRFQTDSTAQKKVIMQVILDDLKPDVIKGTQVITGANDCTAKFSVELARPTQK